MKDISKSVPRGTRGAMRRERKTTGRTGRIKTMRKRNRRLPAQSTGEQGKGPVLSGWPLVVISWGVAFMAVAGAGTGILYGWKALRSNARFTVQSIEIGGIERARAQDISTYSGVIHGKSILDLDLDVMAVNVRRHPWIADVGVRRRLPDRLQVTVQEHTPRILVGLGDVYVANEAGEVFKKLAAWDDIVLPVVTGLQREWVAAHPKEAGRRIVEGAGLMDAFNHVATHLGELDELHWDEHMGWSIRVSPSMDEQSRGASLQVHLGHAPKERLPAAVRSYERLLASGLRPDILWVDGEKQPHRVHARLIQKRASSTEPTLIAKAR